MQPIIVSKYVENLCWSLWKSGGDFLVPCTRLACLGHQPAWRKRKQRIGKVTHWVALSWLHCLVLLIACGKSGLKVKVPKPQCQAYSQPPSRTGHRAFPLGAGWVLTARFASWSKCRLRNFRHVGNRSMLATGTWPLACVWALWMVLQMRNLWTIFCCVLIGSWSG